MSGAKFFKRKKSRVTTGRRNKKGVGGQKASFLDTFKLVVIVAGLVLIFVVGW